MHPFPDEHRRRIAPGWRPLLVGGLVLTLVLCIVVAYRARSTDLDFSTLDFRDFWRTAAHFREKGALSAELGVHNYLPFFTLFMLPWSVLPLQLAAVCFTALSLTLFAFTVVLVELIHETRLPPKPRMATLLAIGLVLPYLWSCATLGQLGLLLLFLVVVAWWLAIRGQEWEAGAALGLAALVKLFPAALVGFAVVRGRWRWAVAAAIVIVVLGVGGPWLSLGWKRTVSEHQAFYERAVVEHAARTTIFAEKPQKAKYNNNSLPIVLRRLLSPTDGHPRADRPPLLVNFANLPSGVIWWIYLVVLAGAVTISVAACVRHRPKWPPEDLAGARALHAQFGVWCGLMLLATPLLWTHYLVLMYWPLALLADQAERSYRATGRVHPAAGLPLVIWALGIVGLASPAARASGAQLASVIAVWAGSVYWSRYAAPPADAPSPRQPKRLRLQQPETEAGELPAPN